MNSVLPAFELALTITLKLRESREHPLEHVIVCMVRSVLSSAMVQCKSELNRLFYLRYPLVRDALIFPASFSEIYVGRQTQRAKCWHNGRNF